MKKVFDQLEREGLAAGPWDYEIDALRVEEGMSLWEAQCHVITKWMVVGNFGPLLASIKENGVLRGPALTLLVRMLETGELTFKEKGRGRRPDPEAAVRNRLIADVYEDLRKEGFSHDDLSGAIGRVAGYSEETAKRAVTTKRKAPKAK
jgi:hypothetical protein